MELHSHHKKKRDFTGHACALHPDEATRHAIELALARAVAEQTGCEPDEILCRLGEKFPDLS